MLTEDGLPFQGPYWDHIMLSTEWKIQGKEECRTKLIISSVAVEFIECVPVAALQCEWKQLLWRYGHTQRGAEDAQQGLVGAPRRRAAACRPQRAPAARPARPLRPSRALQGGACWWLRAVPAAVIPRAIVPRQAGSLAASPTAGGRHGRHWPTSFSAALNSCKLCVACYLVQVRSQRRTSLASWLQHSEEYLEVLFKKRRRRRRRVPRKANDQTVMIRPVYGKLELRSPYNCVVVTCSTNSVGWEVHAMFFFSVGGTLRFVSDSLHPDEIRQRDGIFHFVIHV